ncbi:MAG: hypothetical protein U1A77_09075 [Pirellulales bacterium]
MASAIRKSLVDPTEVGVYHCASHCVRRGNVQGRDTVSGLDRTHRSHWIQNRLASLASVFAVEVLDYGLIDNSLHTLLRIRPDVTIGWSDEEVVRRWIQLNRRRLQLKRERLSRKRLDKLLADGERVSEFRKRLSDLSWFMIMLKEPIAREANREDGVSGHFFGERYWCRRCWTIEEAMQAMLFSHTSPVRAGLATTPETAEFSSYRDRLEDQRATFVTSGEFAAGLCRSPSEARNREVSDNASIGHVEVEAGRRVEREESPAASDDRGKAQRRAAFLAPLRLEGVGLAGPGFDEAAAGRRLTNDGYLNITLNQYSDVIAVCRQSADSGSLASEGAERETTERAGDRDRLPDGERGRADSAGEYGPPGDESGRWRASIPSELPVELERMGFDRVRWAESYRRNARRFDRLTRKSDSLRRDFHQRL